MSTIAKYDSEDEDDEDYVPPVDDGKPRTIMSLTS